MSGKDDEALSAVVPNVAEQQTAPEASAMGAWCPGSAAPPLRITLAGAAPLSLTPDEVFLGEREGHAILGGGRLVDRRTPFTLIGPEDEADRLGRLRTICADACFPSAPLVLAQLHDVEVDLRLGLCVTRDGLLLDETAFVAGKIDPSLASSPLLTKAATGDSTISPVVTTETILHCFHRSSPAYGHFVLDGLVTLERARDTLLAGGGKVLVPPYMPPWALNAIRTLGFPEQALLRPVNGAVRCGRLLLASSIDTSTTFRPDPELCSGLRRRLAPAVTAGRRIYLSRANQTSYSNRRILNEGAVRNLLVARGFEVLEPGNMTIEAQAAALGEAAVVVGAHGSTFGNLVFAAPRTLVVDLMPADWVGYWDVDPPAERWLLNLTTALGLDYRLVLCPSRLIRVLPDSDQSGLQKFGMESTVDLRLLAQALDGKGASVSAPGGQAANADRVVVAPPAPDYSLSALSAPALEPLFRLPDRRGTFSAWWGHVPFAAWLVRSARPQSIVELGSFAGVSYFAFCQAVLAEGLDCACHAVDTWEGDVHAGHYGDPVYQDFKRFNHARYSGISTMHRCTFDEALWHFADGTVDILHIDGLHTYDAVRHDFETWLPKMSRRGVVLFHDAVERRSDFGVWQLWEELSARYPSFLFTHSHGLGVLVVGPEAPQAVLDLCASDAVRAARLRDRFGMIGDRWYNEAHWDFVARTTQAVTPPEPESRSVAMSDSAAMEAMAARLHAIETSTIWRTTGVIRSAARRFPWVARQARRTARLAYWTASGQLGTRLARRRAALAAVRGSLEVNNGLAVNNDLEGDDDLEADDGPHAPPTDHAPAADSADYREWVARHDTLRDADRKAIRAHIGRMAERPLISLILVARETPEPLLREAITSVITQLWPCWELCIAIDFFASAAVTRLLTGEAADPRVKWLRRDIDGGAAALANSALSLASGDLVAFLNVDDLLSEHALYQIAAEIEAHPQADVIYSDSDRMDGDGMRSEPYFKPDFDPDLLLAQNFLGPLVVYRRPQVAREGLREDIDGSEGHDLALRLTAGTDPARIRHIPAILVHRRQRAASTLPAAARVARDAVASLRVVQEHLAIAAPGAKAEPNPLMPHRLRIRWPLPNPAPTVTVIIATRDRAKLLAHCLNDILFRTDYPAVEVIVVDNGSQEANTIALLQRLQTADARVRVISAPGPFNYAALNNRAARAARGEILLLLNNDVEVLERDWLREMASHALKPDVGAVGAKLIYANGTIQHAGVVLGVGGSIASHFHYGAPRAHPGYFGSLTLAHSVSAVTGACLALRREVFEAIGGLDETNLSIGYNDVDLCLRIRECGLRIVWTPFAELYHLESASRGADTTSEQTERLRQETAYMKERWGKVLAADPYYNLNVSLARNDYGVGPAPRRVQPWQREASLAPMSEHA